MIAADELTTRAAFLWSLLLLEDHERIPAYAAVDLLRQHADTDDVSVVKLLLYGAAADWLEGKFPAEQRRFQMWEVSGPRQVNEIRRGDLSGERVRLIRKGRPFGVPDPTQQAWLEWCERADYALTLCREIEGVPT